jgi:hypothetical protein
MFAWLVPVSGSDFRLTIHIPQAKQYAAGKRYVTKRSAKSQRRKKMMNDE